VEPLQPMSKNAFYVLISVLFFSVLGGLAVYFGGQVFNVYMLCTKYFHAVSGWVGGVLRRLVNMYMCCIDCLHSMSRFGGRLVDLFSQWMSKKKVENKSEEVKIPNPLLHTQPMSTNTFNVKVPAISLSFLGGLVVCFRGQVFNVYTFCTNNFHIMIRFGGRLVDLLSQSKPKKAIDNKNKEVQTEKPRVPTQPMPENMVESKNKEVKIRNPLLHTQPMSTNTFNVKFQLIFTVVGGLMATFREKLFKVYTFCTYYFHLICRWIGNLLRLVKQSILSPSEIKIEIKKNSEEIPTAVPELNEEVLTVNPNDNERLKIYIQTIIGSLESLAHEIQQPLLDENAVKSVLKRVDEIPELIQKSIASLEFVHGKLYSSF
jgi:hypothetical protein